MDSYKIKYNFTVNECSSDNKGKSRQVIIPIVNSSLRSYTINDSSDNPVEEDSIYNISLTAVNSVESSVAARNAHLVMTNTTGMSLL